jgi:hypothetical protein
MGANFCTLRYDGNLTKEQVIDRFESDQEQCRYENGHSYSGGIGMANGISFPGKEFETADEAYNWVDETAEKWEAALAVRYKDSEGKWFWFIGALCSS